MNRLPRRLPTESLNDSTIGERAVVCQLAAKLNVVNIGYRSGLVSQETDGAPENHFRGSSSTQKGPRAPIARAATRVRFVNFGTRRRSGFSITLTAAKP